MSDEEKKPEVFSVDGENWNSLSEEEKLAQARLLRQQMMQSMFDGQDSNEEEEE